MRLSTLSTLALLVLACEQPTPRSAVAGASASTSAGTIAEPAQAPPSSASAAVAPAAASASAATSSSATASSSAEDTPLAVEELRGIRFGARVRLKMRDRALQPAETGHDKPVAYGPGQEGSVVRFVHRRSSGYEFDVAVVRWDAQTWYEWDIPLHRMKEGVVYSGEDINRMNRENGAAVHLPSFELAAHPETLEVVGGASTAASPSPSGTSGAKPKRVLCKPPLRKVEGRYVVFVRDAGATQAIADDLKVRLHITLRRVWPALGSFSADITPARLADVLKDERLESVEDDCVG